MSSNIVTSVVLVCLMCLIVSQSLIDASFHSNERIERSPLNKKHKLLFVVKSQASDDKIEEELLRVSDPRSPSYGKHWKKAEVEQLKRNPESSKLVRDFLGSHNSLIEEINGERDGADLKIWATASLSTWETIFQAEFWNYRSVNTRRVFSRSISYTLPIEFVGHVDSVVYISDFPTKVEHHMKVGDPLKKMDLVKEEDNEGSSEEVRVFNNQSPYVIPEFLRDYLGVSDLFTDRQDYLNFANLNLTQMVYAGLNESYQPHVLDTFLASTGAISPINIEYLGRPGFNSSRGCENFDSCQSYEASLDIQYLTSIAQGIKTYFYADDFADDGPFLLTFTNYLLQMSDEALPNVVSISYGASEIGQEIAASGAVVPDQASTGSVEVEKNFKELGLRGTTIVVSSGDNGAPGSYVDDKELGLGCKVGYEPVWPASSPWVTSVGAVMGPEENVNPEVCNAHKGGVVTSGGGFSNLFARPEYQRTSVRAYLQSFSVPPAPYDAAFYARYGYGKSAFQTGRGYPDVANLGHNYIIMVLLGGNITQVPVSGTSASAPVTAAMLSLSNAVRAQRGQAPFGFANPALYGNTLDTFIDITVGNNDCTEKTCCSFGYGAVGGWDAVTGHGIPLMAKLADAKPDPTHSSDGNGSSTDNLVVGIVSGLLGFSACVAISIWGYLYFQSPKQQGQGQGQGATAVANAGLAPPSTPAPAIAAATAPQVVNPMAGAATVGREVEKPTVVAGNPRRDLVPPPTANEI